MTGIVLANPNAVLMDYVFGHKPLKTDPLSKTVDSIARTPITGVGVRGESQRYLHRQASSDTLAPELDSRLFDLKARTGLVAMHLSSDWREGFFRQLDFLMSPENWEDIDSLPSVGSYDTALRLVIFLGQIKRPGLGLTHYGNIILSWTRGSDRLTIECLPGDDVKWILSHHLGERRETAAGTNTAERVPVVLQAYGPEKWLAAE